MADDTSPETNGHRSVTTTEITTPRHARVYRKLPLGGRTTEKKDAAM